MALNANGLNAQVAGLTAVASYASLHTAEPDATGSAEVTGGTYSREAISWTLDHDHSSWLLVSCHGRHFLRLSGAER